MRDRINQVVLGVFLGVFAYCLVVLRTIRGGDEGAFVPSLAVLGGLILALVGTGFLIYFIHYIAMSIQASSIIAAAAKETIEAIDRMFPKAVSDDGDQEADGTPAAALEEQAWSAVTARKTGYVETIDTDSLLAFAREQKTVVRMECGIGEFVVEGAPLVSVARTDKPDEEAAADLNAAYVISRHRTVDGDVGYGIRQIVDIAIKALSPGINDTTTAVMCVDYLGAILARLAVREMTTPHRLDEGELRVIARGASFEGLLAEAFDQIRQNAEGNAAILMRQLQSLELIAGRTMNARRRQAMRQQAGLITAIADRTIPSPHDGAGVRAASARLSRVFDGG